MENNPDRCPHCWGKYNLEIKPRPITMKSWMELGKKVTNYKYVCSCGCSWERTNVDAIAGTV